MLYLVAQDRKPSGDEVTTWADSPLIRGSWRPVIEPHALAIVSRIERGPYSPSIFYTGEYDIECLRAMRLRCYVDTLLVELQATLHEPKRRAVATYIYGPDSLKPVMGTSEIFHARNARRLLRVETEDAALEYARLFCAGTHGEAGPFAFVDGPEDIPWREETAADEQMLVAARRGNSISCADNGDWKINATIRYSTALFSSQLVVRRSGEVGMTEDVPLIEDLPIIPGCFEAPFRFAGISPAAEPEAA